MNQKIWAQYAAIQDPAERMAIGLRQFLHQAMRDATWGWVIVRIGLVAAPLSETIERGLLSDLETGVRLKRFQVESMQAAIDLVLGTALMAMRTILEGHSELNYPEQVTKLILKSLGVDSVDAEAIAFKALEPFPECATRGRAMTDGRQLSSADDLHALNRFLQAQSDQYEQALSEVKRGRKDSHWMWYLFPQFDGLGKSATSQKYSIKSIAEAKAYLNHPVLGPRLTAIATAALNVEGRSAYEIFGAPDDMKLKSCATLFASVSPNGSVFEQILDKFFQGDRDPETLRLLGIRREGK